MCGIAGAFAVANARKVGELMTAAVAHRGPDDSGLCVFPLESGNRGSALGHRRLSIIDLSPTGCQPMASTRGRYTIVFNGEIYNYRELREELLPRGARFRGASDTEVILEGWRLDGPGFLRRLRGMFAFAMWDDEERCGWLARDPLGIKPLWIAERQGAVLFGSELRALMASGLVERRLSRDAVGSFLAFGSVSEPRSAIDGVTSLPAGAVARVRVCDERASVEIVDVHDPFIDVREPLITDFNAAAALVAESLRDSVAHHLIADVPVALFLSGGIDSSAVVALAAQASEAKLDGFTVVFGESAFDETGPATAVAKRYGIRHHTIPLAGAGLLEALPHAFTAMDQPSLDGLNTFVVSDAVRKAGIKVVLSGLGGDEMFAGYVSFERGWRARHMRGVPLGIRRALASGAIQAGPLGEKAAVLLAERDPARGAYLASRLLFPDRQRQLLTARPGTTVALSEAPAHLTLLQRIAWYELTGYMRNTLLRDSDVFSMAHQLELRVPFVDLRVLAASLRLDDRLKLDPRINKRLIVAALGDGLPEEVWNRPKQGFTLPFAPWMRGEMKAELASVFASSERLARVGLEPAASRGIWNGFIAGRRGYTWSRPWALYTLVRWAEGLDLSVSGGTASDPPHVAAVA